MTTTKKKKKKKEVSHEEGGKRLGEKAGKIKYVLRVAEKKREKQAKQEERSTCLAR